ncbi:hypothetical protein AXFE_02990 [Acidithrix ferrooxidans]|uniref:Uncharacterized protein n=1 Tax=Acidithrix ferrooxidans TaxID=1280514 RepID=A0A0D8HLJ9_9ACTN|nr:hypothetical protein AXFE_02990 [Acidithrix ferrooxidans]
MNPIASLSATDNLVLEIQILSRSIKSIFRRVDDHELSNRVVNHHPTFLGEPWKCLRSHFLAR